MRKAKSETFIEVVEGVYYMGGERNKILSDPQHFRAMVEVACKSYPQYMSLENDIYSIDTPCAADVMAMIKEEFRSSLRKEPIRFSDRRGMYYVIHEGVKISTDAEYVQVTQGNSPGYSVELEKSREWIALILLYLGYITYDPEMEGIDGQLCETEDDSEITYKS